MKIHQAWSKKWHLASSALDEGIQQFLSTLPFGLPLLIYFFRNLQVPSRSFGGTNSPQLGVECTFWCCISRISLAQEKSICNQLGDHLVQYKCIFCKLIIYIGLRCYEWPWPSFWMQHPWCSPGLGCPKLVPSDSCSKLMMPLHACSFCVPLQISEMDSLVAWSCFTV